MTCEEFIREATKGGPGLDGYAYQADVYCVDCGQQIVREIAPYVAADMPDTDNPAFRDSERVPQPIFFGETDRPEYCAQCGEMLPTEVVGDYPLEREDQ